MTYSHRFPRFLKWLTLHDNFMHTSVSFSSCCHIWASKLCLVSSYWLLILVANLDSSASACTLKSGELPLLMRASLVQCDGHCLEARMLSLFPWGLLCNTRAWERCPGLRVMVAHTTGTNMHFIKFHIPKWTTAIPANAPAPHIEHGFTTLL